MKDTKIAWTDATWNPVTGCTKVSPGCDHCYAEAVAERFRGGKAFPHGFDVTLHPDRLDAPRHWRKPKRIFVNSMSDLFHKDIPDEFLVDVWATMLRYAAAHIPDFDQAAAPNGAQDQDPGAHASAEYLARDQRGESNNGGQPHPAAPEHLLAARCVKALHLGGAVARPYQPVVVAAHEWAGLWLPPSDFMVHCGRGVRQGP